MSFLSDWRFRAVALFLGAIAIVYFFASGVAGQLFDYVDPYVSWWKYALFLIVALVVYFLTARKFEMLNQKPLPDKLIFDETFGSDSDPWRKEQGYELRTHYWPHPKLRSMKIAGQNHSATVLFFHAKNNQQFRGLVKAVALHNLEGHNGDRFILEGTPKMVLNYLQSLDMGGAVYRSAGNFKHNSLYESVAPVLEMTDDPIVQAAILNNQNSKNQTTPPAQPVKPQ